MHGAPYEWKPMDPDARMGARLLALAVLLAGVTLMTWGRWEAAVAGVLALAALAAGSARLRGRAGGVRGLDAVLRDDPEAGRCAVTGCGCRGTSGVAS
jgi:hypothetical protein